MDFCSRDIKSRERGCQSRLLPPIIIATIMWGVFFFFWFKGLIGISQLISVYNVVFSTIG